MACCPYAYGLALGGTDGIVHVLRSLLAEAGLIMAVDGYPALAQFTTGTVPRVVRGVETGGTARPFGES